MAADTSKIDRLSTLISRFSLTVSPAAPEVANLAILPAADGPDRRLVFEPRGRGPMADASITASVDWGGSANPLLEALPERVEMAVPADSDAAHLVALFEAEAAAMRCGAPSVLDRLGEVIVIRLLRAEIERGSARPGLLAGLADPRLSRAIVAIHDAPGRAWMNADLAAIAGLSLSRFAEVFAATVGETPSAYLRRWRLTLVRQDLARGARVDALARRYGYASGEALSRAYRKAFGEAPTDARRTAA